MGRRTTAVTVDMTHGKKAMATRAMPKPASPITRLAAKTTRAPMAQATVTEAFSSTLSERSIAVRTETGARARPAFRVCYSASPMLEQHLPRWLRWAEDPEQARRAPFLARAPLFAGLPRRLLGRLAPRFFEKTYHAGEIVFHEGDPGRALFVVLEGAVEIIQISAQGEYLLRTLGPGDAFGELALIDASPRSATARVDQRALAEGVAGTERAQEIFALGRYLNDLHRPLQNDEERPSGIALVKDDLAGVVGLLEEAGGEPPKETAGEPGEEGSPREKGRASGQLGILCPPEPTREVLLQHRRCTITDEAGGRARRPLSRHAGRLTASNAPTKMLR